jgi:hypothetical protein
VTDPKVPTVKVGDDRWYIIGEDGKKVPGVSSILNVKAKPALIGWAAREAAEYAVDNWPEVQKLLNPPLPDVREMRAGGGSDKYKNRKAAVTLISGAYRRSSGKKAQSGTDVHLYVEQLLKGRLKGQKVPAEAMKYLRQLATWAGEYDVKMTHSEQTVANTSIGYAGTLDSVLSVKIPGVRKRQSVIVDWKTGASGVWPEAALQQSAYKHAEFMVMPDGTHKPMPVIDAAYALWLRPNGYAFIPLLDSWEGFKHLAAFYHWEQANGKNMVQSPINAKPIKRERKW